jgi:hypothetical protein
LHVLFVACRLLAKAAQQAAKSGSSSSSSSHVAQQAANSGSSQVAQQAAKSGSSTSSSTSSQVAQQAANRGCSSSSQVAQQAANSGSSSSSSSSSPQAFASTTLLAQCSEEEVLQDIIQEAISDSTVSLTGNEQYCNKEGLSGFRTVLQAAIDAIYPARSLHPELRLLRAAAIVVAHKAPSHSYRMLFSEVESAVVAAVGSPADLGLSASFSEIMTAGLNASFKHTPSPNHADGYLKLDVQELLHRYNMQQVNQWAVQQFPNDPEAAADAAFAVLMEGIGSSSSSSSYVANACNAGSSASSGFNASFTSSSSSGSYTAALTNSAAFPRLPNKAIAIVNPATGLPIPPPQPPLSRQATAPSAVFEPAAAAAAAGPALSAYAAVLQAYQAAALALMPPAPAAASAGGYRLSAAGCCSFDNNDDVIYVPDDDYDEQLFAHKVMMSQAEGVHKKMQSSAEEDQVDGLQWPALQQQVLAQWWA